MNECEKKRFIYVVLSKTSTRFGRVIRKIGNQEYNHASVSLDSSLQELYAFGRPRHSALLLGRLVQESMERYTLQKDGAVPVVICKVPVSEQEYQWIKGRIQNVYEDSEYIYNLFSVLTYPIFGGFEAYKSYTCVEFVAHLLQYLNYTDKPISKYTPDDILKLLEEQIMYQGDIKEYDSQMPETSMYFEPMNWRLYLASIKVLGLLMKRSVYYKLRHA